MGLLALMAQLTPKLEAWQAQVALMVEPLSTPIFLSKPRPVIVLARGKAILAPAPVVMWANIKVAAEVRELTMEIAHWLAMAATERPPMPTMAWEEPPLRDRPMMKLILQSL